jgi:predicted component of type VI protein secretion system
VVQIDILSGSKAGSQVIARRFPFVVGRNTQATLALEDGGVWDNHFELSMRPADGIVLTSAPEALTLVNGTRFQEARLRNGDLIEAGSVKLRFNLSPTSQRGLAFRETATWTALALLCFGQVALIYWLIS